MLRAKTRELWERLESEPTMAGFVLIGGSALALRLGHRTSEDLDFAYVGVDEQWVSSDESPARELTLPRCRLEVLVERLRAESRLVEHNEKSEDLDDFASAGMELADYQQNYLVDGVKMSIFSADTPLQTVLLSGVQSGVRLAGLDELFASKALVSGSRSNTRDWFDLYYLMTAGGYTVNDFVGVFLRSADLNRLHLALHRLCSGRPGTDDSGFSALVEDAPTLDQITAFFVEERDRYERSLGKAASRVDTKAIESPGFVWAEPGLAEQVAEAKGRDRVWLAALPPEKAQAIVSVRARLGAVKSCLPLQERPTLGLSGLLDREES